jgi:hypothetical protein
VLFADWEYLPFFTPSAWSTTYLHDSTEADIPATNLTTILLQEWRHVAVMASIFRATDLRTGTSACCSTQLTPSERALSENAMGNHHRRRGDLLLSHHESGDPRMGWGAGPKPPRIITGYRGTETRSYDCSAAVFAQYRFQLKYPFLIWIALFWF